MTSNAEQQQQEESGIQFDLTKPTPADTVGRVTTYTFADGSTFALPPSPCDVYEVAIDGAVESTLSIVKDFIQKANNIAGDPLLTPMGKANKRQPLVEAALKQVSGQWAKVQKFADDLQKRIADFYTPVRATDAVAKLDDIETCRWFRTMSPDDRTRFLPSFASGQWLAVATSLKRSPLPWFEDTNLIEKAWTASRDAAAPAMRAELEAEAASVRWAQLAIRRLAEQACKSAGLADTHVFQVLKGLQVADPSAGPFKMPQTVPAKAA
ncbi:hypothetical protein [Rudaea sp.]|uniref:hypothetical protein n=1 Tax=Rudaea sp. TaxID=2136325 RepID=UPI0032202B41